MVAKLKDANEDIVQVKKSDIMDLQFFCRDELSVSNPTYSLVALAITMGAIAQANGLDDSAALEVFLNNVAIGRDIAQKGTPID